MAETEGVIKYRLDFEPGPPPEGDLHELIVCREILHGLNMIGEDPLRYGGHGFGNLSQRRPEGRFVISASQTGGLERLGSEHFCCVIETDIAANRVRARGMLAPSSEALTHAMIYRLDEGIGCVLHVHEPRLWRYGLDHGLPATARDIPYGTPEMARAVRMLFEQGRLHDGVLFMAGHEDGVIAFGGNVDEALWRLLCCWVEAR